MSENIWEADPAASFARRLGNPPEVGVDTGGHGSCPDLWELSNGDIAIIGRDLTESYRLRLPDGVGVRSDERLVIVPRRMVIAAKADIPDA